MVFNLNPKSTFMGKDHIEKNEHGPYFNVSAIQASWVTLTIYTYSDKSQEKHNISF